jgi:DNA-directed RNA polymerase specialized sigma24 family protein
VLFVRRHQPDLSSVARQICHQAIPLTSFGHEDLVQDRLSRVQEHNGHDVKSAQGG